MTTLTFLFGLCVVTTVLAMIAGGLTVGATLQSLVERDEPAPAWAATVLAYMVSRSLSNLIGTLSAAGWQ